MKKVFLVKKDPEMPGAEGNWIIMSFEEFERFLETEEGRRRKDCFERLDAASEDDDIRFSGDNEVYIVSRKTEKEFPRYNEYGLLEGLKIQIEYIGRKEVVRDKLSAEITKDNLPEELWVVTGSSPYPLDING